MSETSAEVKTSAPAVNLDEFGQMAKDRLRQTIEQHNTLASRVKAATGDPQALLDNLRETYTEGDAGKYTAAIEELDNKREALIAKRDEILKPIVAQMVEDAKAGVGDAEAQAADLLKTIKAGQKYLTDLYGDAAVEDLPKIVGRRAASGGTGGGTGARRVRGYDVYVDGSLATAADAQGNKKSNLAAAAKNLGLNTEDLRNVFMSAAGSEDSKAWPAVVEFDVTVTEGEDPGKPVTKHIVCKKQVTATPGAPAVSGAANTDSQTAKAS